ncbi:MAG: extracellular solute-binding protein [Chloroflexi bacterium]|nr:extracellular solute-binding protein [Chloroflexota bacterium]
MRKLVPFLLIAILVLAGGVVVSAQDEAACNIAAPSAATSIDMIGWSFPITDLYADALEACNEVENLNVNTQLLTSSDAQGQVRLALSGGGESPFEIVHADDGFILEMATNGWAMPLDDLIAEYSEAYGLDDIPASLFEAATIDGQVYGIPFTANTMHFFYRTDLFEQYEIEVPETYDDVIAACAVLSEDPTLILPFTMNLHAGWAWRTEFHNFLGSFGGEWLNEDSTPAFNNEAGVAAVEKMLEVVDACMGAEGLTYSIDDSEIGMEQGDLAMVNIWASRAANMDNPDLSNFVGIIGFAPAPRANPDGPFSGPAATDFYVIPANTPVDPDLIFQVIMEAVDVETQTAAAELGIVTRTSVAESGVGGRYLEAASRTIAEGVGNYGDDPAVAIARVAIENNLPRVITEGLSPQEALDAAAAEYVTEATAQGFLE